MVYQPCLSFNGKTGRHCKRCKSYHSQCCRLQCRYRAGGLERQARCWQSSGNPDSWIPETRPAVATTQGSLPSQPQCSWAGSTCPATSPQNYPPPALLLLAEVLQAAWHKKALIQCKRGELLAPPVFHGLSQDLAINASIRASIS